MAIHFRGAVCLWSALLGICSCLRLHFYGTLLPQLLIIMILLFRKSSTVVESEGRMVMLDKPMGACARAFLNLFVLLTEVTCLINSFLVWTFFVDNKVKLQISRLHRDFRSKISRICGVLISINLIVTCSKLRQQKPKQPERLLLAYYCLNLKWERFGRTYKVNDENKSNF